MGHGLICFVCLKPVTDSSTTVYINHNTMHFKCVIIYTIRKAKLNIKRNRDQTK